MWIITNKGLLSVVQDRENPELLIVRARQDGLLEILLEEANLFTPVWQDETADYPNRMKLTRVEFTELIYGQVAQIDYGNFKDSVKDRKLKYLLHRVWATLVELGTGKYYGFKTKLSSKRPLFSDAIDVEAEEAYLKSLPSRAFLDDGRLDPDYITGDDYA